MDEEEKKNLRSELESKRKELEILKDKLGQLNIEKESWFDKKKQITRQLSDIARNIRDVRIKRDSYTRQVKQSKSRRQELNKQLKDKIEDMKKLQKEKREITKKFSIKGDLSRIKEEIEKLESKVETEALPFKIEQQIMKKISEKKKMLTQYSEVSDVFEKIHALQRDIDKVRQKADDTHKKVQTKADESQKYHEEFVDTAKEVEDLRQKEEEHLKNFVEAKERWSSQNDLVRAKQTEITDIRVKLGEITLEEKKKVKKAEAKKMEDQERTVEEKIKKGLKLTTEDLLVFQAKEGLISGNKRSKDSKSGKSSRSTKKSASADSDKKETNKETTK